MAATPKDVLLKKLKINKNKILVVLEAIESSREVGEDKYSLCKNQVEEYLSNAALLEEQLVDIYLNDNVEEDIVETFSKDCALFRLQALEKLAGLRPAKVEESETCLKKSDKVKGVNITPSIVCPKFNDRDLETDKLAFLNFHREFLNCVSSLDSDSLRLVVLKNHLTGYAFQIVKHLSVSDENYEIALELLSNEFLDESCVVDSIFSSLLNTDRLYSNLDVKKFLTDVKTQAYELKNSFSIDFLECGTPGNRLLGHIVFGKLPVTFRAELVHKVNNNYPSLEQILDNCTDIIRTLELCKYDPGSRRPDFSVKRSNNKFKPSLPDKRPSTLENFHVKTSKVKYRCCFCKSNDHKAHMCKSYPTFKDKLRRCNELVICSRCVSHLHGEKDCPCNGRESELCWSCNRPGHRSVMCPMAVKPTVSSNACWMTSSSSLLPVVNISVNVGGKDVSFNCLVDTGSERSYLCKGLIRKISMSSPMKSRRFLIKTFLGNKVRDLQEIDLRVKFQDESRQVSFLLDEHLDLSFKIEGLGGVISDLRKDEVKLAADFSCMKNDMLPVHGLIGIDVIKFLGPLQLTQFKDGFAFSSSQGMILFGDVSDFKSCCSVREQAGLNYNRVVGKFSSCNVTHVYFVLEPKSNHLDPWSCFDEAAVDRTIENMFNLETLGVTDEVCSSYDKIKIADFRSSIEYRDGSYYVSLPWNLDKLNEVPSSYNVALAVLDKVVNKLSDKNLYSDYCKVFLDQENEGIIERIHVPPSEFAKYTWIPHRPVYKTESQCTTKIRPVFNCSLRTGGKPSLNDCAYTGVNLYTDMLELLFKFRTDTLVLLADIRKAFLMVKLKNEFDKNRFCFFLKLEDELVCFRYSTLIFGFVSSPFILCYIVKYHVEKHAAGPCRDMLLNNFYVDNLVKTHQSQSELLKLYVEAVTTMEKGGFELKTCSSNSEIVSQRIQLDNNGSTHGMVCEKVLGYTYDPMLDEMKLSSGGVERVVSTKRDMLSVNSSIFDPLGLVLPITIKGKIMLSQVWKLGIGWDQAIPNDILSLWNSFQKSLKDIQNIGFNRCSVQTDLPVILIMFCDASNRAYGIVEYMYQRGRANLFFAKAKVAPSVKRTLPTLELLAVFLGIKHVIILVKMFPNLFKEIIVAVDAQVVLSWLLSETINTKCQFTRNRLKDIKSMVNELTDKGYTIKFRYVNTVENPADLVTRGVPLDKFTKEKDFWLSGPVWLRGNCLEWPEYTLACLSEKSRELTTAYTGCEVETDVVPVIKLERFSVLSRVIRILAMVFKFIAKLKKVKDVDPLVRAKLYLVMFVQNQFFREEKNFLLNSSEKEVPRLVAKYNLFLDERNIIRCRGRIDGCLYFSDEVKHPVLLPKSSHVTTLFIRDFHVRCKHLGIAATLERLRNAGFWIPKARQAVKTVLADCATCKRYNSLSFRYPKVTNLPRHRVNLVRPFVHTGIDFTGHLWVSEGEAVRKMYILVFTCFNVRAVHLELLPDVSTYSVVLAFFRFFNLYGVPTHIYSDNALSFVAGCDIVKRVLLADEFGGSLDTCSIKHHTIPLYSAWFGAMWERLIKTVKNCLFKVVGRGRLNYFQLLTVLSDIQRSINDRPLTYRCSDDNGLEVITPNAFLRSYPGSAVFLNFDEEMSSIEPPSRSDLIDSLKYRESILNKFRSMWYEQYLMSLRELSSDLYQSSFDNKIKVNDVVLIKGFKSRPHWSLGRVMKLTQGSDGLVRSALIKRGDTLQEHSIKHLFPLELSITHSFQAPAADQGDDLPEGENVVESVREDQSRPVRHQRSVKERNPDYLWY